MHFWYELISQTVDLIRKTEYDFRIQRQKMAKNQLLYVTPLKKKIEMQASVIGAFSAINKLGKLKLILTYQGKCLQLMICRISMLLGELVDQCYVLE